MSNELKNNGAHTHASMNQDGGVVVAVQNKALHKPGEVIEDTPEHSTITASSFSGTVGSEESVSNVPVLLEMTSRRIFKNVIVICVVFFLNFIAYNGLAALQSSIHVQQGMGVITQAVLYVTTALSSLVLPKMVIR